MSIWVSQVIRGIAITIKWASAQITNKYRLNSVWFKWFCIDNIGRFAYRLKVIINEWMIGVIREENEMNNVFNRDYQSSILEAP